MFNRPMIYRILFLILLAFTIEGCSNTQKFIPMTGGTCSYKTTKSYAVVKEIHKEYILLDYSTKYIFRLGQKYVQRKAPNTLSVSIGEVLPAEIYSIKQGSCTPLSFSLKTKEYFNIKKTVIFFSSDGDGIIEKDATAKLHAVAKAFLKLKEEYPKVLLTLHPYATKGTEEYRYGVALSWHAKIVQKELIKQGIPPESMRMIVSEKEPKRDSVSFTVELKAISAF